MKTRRSLDDLMVLLVLVASVLCAAVPVVDLAWVGASPIPARTA